jgi:hypothetical protein
MRVPVFDVVRWARGPHAPAIRAYQEDIQRVRWREWSPMMKILIAVISLLPPTLIYVSSKLTKHFGVPEWLEFVSLPVCMAAVIVLLLRAQRAATVKVARRAMLRYGWCASCGYSLEGVAAAADGCRVCPECGAAWARS